MTFALVATRPLAAAGTLRGLAALGSGLLTGALGCTSSDTEHSDPAEDAAIAAVDAAAEPAPEDGAISPETLREAYRASAETFSLLPIDWQACPLITDGPGTDAFCADISVPRTWLAPDSGTRSVFVKHVPSLDPPVQQVWLLGGGPGLAGDRSELLALILRAQLPSAELYILDYRGTGRSGRLACPSEDGSDDLFVDAKDSDDPGSAVKLCFDAIEAAVAPPGLRDFNTTETAMDVGALADALRTPGRQITIFAISFGTYVAHRYLHLFPEQPGAVVLDSFSVPDGLTNRDLDVDRTARDILGSCAMDPDCHAHLGADPTGFATNVVERLGDGHCPELASAGIDVAQFQAIAAGAVFDSAQRPFLPALYYRADRCAPADVSALVKYRSPSEPTPLNIRDSDPLNLLVSRSELLGQANLDSGTGTLIASAGLAAFYAAIWDAVPTYARDAFWGEWANTSAPILILQADLDAQTPRSNGEAARAHFTGPDAHFVSFPWTNHGVVFRNPGCGDAIVAQFMANPTAAPDSSCTAEIGPPRFAVAPDEALARFGERDLWENDAP